MDWTPVMISLKTAGVSIAITFFLGIMAAWMVVSMNNDWWKGVVDALFTLPLVLPPTVAGFFLLYLFGVKRPLGRFFIEYFGMKIVFSWGATVIAAVVMSFPLMYRSARGAFEQVDPDLCAAARTLGMSEWAIFRRILFANALPGIISGGVLSFARGASLGLRQCLPETLPEKQGRFLWRFIRRWLREIWKRHILMYW